MRILSVLIGTFVACGSPHAERAPAETAATSGGSAPVISADTTRQDTTSRTPGDTLAHARSPIIRAIYVNRYAAQSPAKMRHLIGIADSTEVNALVLDMKDEFGLNFAPRDSLVRRNMGRAGSVARLHELLDTLKAHGILPIARVVVFKDSVTARLNPSWTIRKPDGGEWKDKTGLTWVSPYDSHVWDYDLRVVDELLALGFGEIQFDYIRFPEPYPSLPKQVFPGANGRTKQQALSEFLTSACTRTHAVRVRCSADIFGLVTTVAGALEVGQEWEKLAPVTDVLLPMVYPSHYPKGAFGLARPNADPYKVVNLAIARAHQRNLKLGIDRPDAVRPYLQAFSLGKMLPKYGPHELEEQKRAVYDAGYDGWVLWEPGSRYDAFRPGLEATLVSRAKPSAKSAPAAGQKRDSTRVDSAAMRDTMKPPR